MRFCAHLANNPNKNLYRLIFCDARGTIFCRFHVQVVRYYGAAMDKVARYNLLDTRESRLFVLLVDLDFDLDLLVFFANTIKRN